jgi:UDP-N-acetylglucosamine/UDP-N-acetylgalactosamine diphosphorylase
MYEKNSLGELKYKYGVILNYLFDLHELQKSDAIHMPIHLSRKKIPFCNHQGETVIPANENGYKLETLTVDMIELVGSCLPYEINRKDEFAPIKNRTGVDSLESAQRILSEKGVI